MSQDTFKQYANKIDKFVSSRNYAVFLQGLQDQAIVTEY